MPEISRRAMLRAAAAGTVAAYLAPRRALSGPVVADLVTWARAVDMQTAALVGYSRMAAIMASPSSSGSAASRAAAMAANVLQTAQLAKDAARGLGPLSLHLGLPVEPEACTLGVYAPPKGAT